MKLLFDLNVLIDVAARWQKFPESYAAYNALLERADHAICLPACGYTTLYYVLAKLLSEEQARQTVRRFTDVMGVTPFDDKTVRLAHQLDFTDFEDAAVAASAVAGHWRFFTETAR